jgi:hypothetical protein
MNFPFPIGYSKDVIYPLLRKMAFHFTLGPVPFNVFFLSSAGQVKKA